MMKKYHSIVRIVVAIAIAFGVQTTANAQLGGLVKKAKSAVKDKVENKAKEAAKQTAGDAGLPVSNDSDSDGSSAKGKHPKSLKDLNKELFIYSVTDNPDFYDVTNPKVEKGYVDFCNVCTQTESEGRHVPYEMLEFECSSLKTARRPTA